MPGGHTKVRRSDRSPVNGPDDGAPDYGEPDDGGSDDGGSDDGGSSEGGSSDRGAGAGGGEGATRSSRRRRPRPPAWKLWAVGAVAAASGLGVALAGLRPTGTAWVDVVWSVAFGAIVAAAGSRARRKVLVVVAGVAAVVGAGLALLFGVAALLVGLYAAWHPRRARLAGAVMAGLAVQGLVRMPDWSWAPVGTSAVVAAVAAGAVCVSGWRNSSRGWRRLWRRVAVVGVVVGGVATVAFGVAAAASYGNLRQGVATARSGVDAARTDERLAAARFREAEAELDGALRWVGSPLLWPTRLVPVVALQQRAVVEATDTARNLAGSAAEGAALVERDGLRPADGSIDTSAVTELVEPLEGAVGALGAASVDLADLASPWLLPPVAERLDDLATSVDDALPGVALALQGAEVVPAMAGGDGPRQWLLLVPTPAESRLLGGFVGNWALLGADDGDIDVLDDGPVREVNRQLAVAERRVDASEAYRLRYGRYNPDLFFQNVTASPDYPAVARVASSFWEQSVGTPVDGVIVMDPFALGTLVDLGGPVDIPTLGTRFTGDELSRFLVTDVYELDEDTQDDVFAEAIEGAVDNLTSGSLPGPGKLADAFAADVEAGRLLMWSPEPAEQAFIVALGLDGALPVNVGQDFTMLAVANVAPNKIDTYLERDITYTVDYDAATGETVAEFTAVLTNTATVDLPPVVIGNSGGLPPGTARTYVSLYSPLVLESLRRDGEEIGVESQREGGWRTWSTQVRIPAGESMELTWTLRGTLATGAYVLQWRPQPLVVPPTLAVEVRATGPGGAVTTVDDVPDPARRFALVVEP